MQGFILFDKNYDASLWHIIKCDRKHRKEIIDMLRALPEEFVCEIRDNIKKLNETEQVSDLDDLSECGITHVGEDGTYYSYSVSKDDELVLAKGMTVDGHNYDKFELNLEYDDFDDLENFCEEWFLKI